MKVLITTDWYAPVINGVVTSVLLLQSELEKMGHEVRVVTLANRLHSYKEGNVYYMGSVSANKIYPGARLRVNRTRSLLQELVAWRPDVIHSQCEFSSFRVAYALSSRLGVPIVHTYHTVYEDYTHYFSPSVRVGRAVVSVFSRWICGRTACVVAPSKKVERLLLDYGVRCRIEVIPTGVDLRAYRQEPDPAEMAALRRRWSIPEGHTVLLYLGRMAKEKNLEQLIDQIAGSGRRDVSLLLVGDGPDREEVLHYARQKGLDVIFTGMVPHSEVANYYRLGDLFVTASTRGLPISRPWRRACRSCAGGTPAWTAWWKTVSTAGSMRTDRASASICQPFAAMGPSRRECAGRPAPRRKSSPPRPSARRRQSCTPPFRRRPCPRQRGNDGDP